MQINTPSLQRVIPRKSILVVEDDEQIRSALVQGLRLSGYDVQEAADGAEALERVDGHRPDLVVLDVVLPGVDGPTVASELRRRAVLADVPILLVSAERDARRRASEIGADFLAKPLKLPVLLSEVARLVAN